MNKKVSFATSDGVKIVGDFYAAENPKAPAVILLHMMPADRTSYKEFASKLLNAGFQALAIDLRGHGESILKEGKEINYKDFSDAEHQQSIKDAEIAYEFLTQGLGLKVVGLVGASIGANLAIQFMTQKPTVKWAVLLSAGLDYRGIKTEPLVEKLRSDQAALFVASKDDMRSNGQSCADMAQILFDKTFAGVKKEIKILSRAGHGTDMLEKEPGLSREIIDWLSLHGGLTSKFKLNEVM